MLASSPAFTFDGALPVSFYDWRNSNLGAAMPEGGQSGPLMYSLLYCGDVAHPEGYSGRIDTFELQINSDPAYGLGDPTSVVTDPDGTRFCRITCSAMPSGAPAALSGGRAYTSGFLSTQKCYAAAFGLWEGRFRLPFDGLGGWPAFWLLPSVKTALNGGQTTEVDVFEMWSNRKVQPGLGRLYSTLHGAHQNASFSGSFDGSTTLTVTAVASGALVAGGRTSQYLRTITSQLSSTEPDGSEGGRGTYQVNAAAPAFTGSMLLVTPVTQAMVADHTNPTQVDNGWHTFGCLITVDTIAIFLDGTQIASTANAGDFAISPDDKHYAIMNLATGGPGSYYGPDGTGPGVSNNTVTPLPTHMDIAYLRHYPLLRAS